METLVSSSGAGLALVLILVTLFVWSLPAALMTAELTSAIPAEGGYYVWAKEALGPFGGFLCGWWSWVYSWVDTSLYPGLFVGYLVAVADQASPNGPLHNLSPLQKWLLGMAMLVPIIWINVRGIKLSGIASVVLGLLLLTPFVLLIGIGIAKFGGHATAIFQPFNAPGKSVKESFGAGLFVIMWNYLAWDSLSTVCGETEHPARNFPKALMWSLLITVAFYFLPFAVGIAAVPDISKWTEGSWTAIASAVGGSWLGLLVAFGAILSVIGMCNATLLSGSRLPLVMAEDKLLPKQLSALHPKHKTPWVGICVSAAFAALLTVKGFAELVKVDVLIYSAGLLLEFAALVVLRYKRPELARRYRIPGGKPGVWLLVLVPTGLIVAAFVITLKGDFEAAMITIGALASGPIVYGVARLARGRKTSA